MQKMYHYSYGIVEVECLDGWNCIVYYKEANDAVWAMSMDLNGTHLESKLPPPKYSSLISLEHAEKDGHIRKVGDNWEEIMREGE